jgi:cytochrome c-type biogenesis protein CcmH/NrfF
MQRIAVMSGGEVIRDDQISSLVDRFEQRVLENSPAEVKRSSIWDRPLVLLSILMIWFVSWVVRRRSGTI